MRWSHDGEQCGHADGPPGANGGIELKLSPLAAPEGVLVTAAIRDISLRRAAEAHLALMEERYRNLLEAAPDIVVVLDRAGTVVLLNHQAEYQFGYDRADLIGQPVSTIIPAGFGDRLAVDGPHRAEDALSRHDGAWFELDARRRDGREFPVEVMLRPVGAGERLLVRVAIRDITARRAAELLLLQKMAELKRSNEELDQFACIASHDLQNRCGWLPPTRSCWPADTKAGWMRTPTSSLRSRWMAPPACSS